MRIGIQNLDCRTGSDLFIVRVSLRYIFVVSRVLRLLSTNGLTRRVWQAIHAVARKRARGGCTTKATGAWQQQHCSLLLRDEIKAQKDGPSTLQLAARCCSCRCRDEAVNCAWESRSQADKKMRYLLSRFIDSSLLSHSSTVCSSSFALLST